MKSFTILSLLGLVAAVSALTSSAANSTMASTTTVVSQTTTASLSPEQTCLAGCARTDICCQAACVKVPCPNQAQANATTECAAQCPQGNGSAADTSNYASCQSSCISSLFFSTATGSANTATSAGASATESGIVSNPTGSESGSSASATGASASSTGAASHLQLGVTSAGVLGLVLMGFAL